MDPTRAAVLLLALTIAFPPGTAHAAEPQRVAYDNAGVDGRQPHLWSGASYRYPETAVPTTAVPADAPERTVAFGNRVEFAYKGLLPGASYTARLTFLSDAPREQRLFIGDQPQPETVKLVKAVIVRRDLPVPAEAYADGTLLLKVECMSGPNAVISEIEILSTNPTPLKPRDPEERYATELAKAAELVARYRPRYTPLPVGPGGTHPTAVSLNGDWSFAVAPPQGFERAATASLDGWQTIEVPGEWVTQGFSVPAGQAGGYRRRFDLPTAWNGQRIRLRFDAVYCDCTVWVNGTEVGGHVGGFTPFELDITDAVAPGADNTLALRVRGDTIADVLASGSKYAAHPLGGIPRKVTLFAVPPLNVQSLQVIGDLDDQYRDGRATLQIEVANDGEASAPFALRCTILAPDGGTAAAVERVAGETMAHGETWVHEVELAVDAPHKWHPETPALYTARVELMRDTGEVVETVQRRFGFRTVDVSGNRMLVNGLPVKLRGVNRHEVHPERGRSLPPGQWRRDVEIFRAGNVNHIRTCHYPPAEELMDAADELGMFVEAEAPFCWARGGDDAYEPIVRQTLELVERDRSHPSVIFWSLGNESGWNGNFAASSLATHRLDPTRPQTFDGGRGQPGEPFCQIHSPHYPGPGAPAKYADSPVPQNFGEYCHLNAYNRHELVTDPGVRDAWGTGMAAMWEKMRQSPGTLGGSLWAGIDDTFFLPDGTTVGYGTWGPIDGWRRPKPEYWHMKNAYAPIRIAARNVSVPAEGEPVRIPVENRYDVTNLKDVRIEAKLDRPGAPAYVAAAEIPPGQSGELTVPIADTPPAGTSLDLRFTDPRGFVAYETRVRIGEPETEAAETTAARTAAGPAPVTAITDETNAWRIATGPAIWRVEKGTGNLTAHTGNSSVLIGGPHLMVLPLNGAGGTQMSGKEPTYAPFTDTCGNWRVGDVTLEAATATVRVTGTYNEAHGAYTMRFTESGDAAIDYDFTMNIDVNPRQLGLVFDLPRACDTLDWRRDGLWTVYPADHIGRLTGHVRAFENMHACGPAGPRTPPDWPWSLDGNELGSNDFRSTKAGIRRAALSRPDGTGLAVVSDGTQHARAWASGEHIRLLIADFNNPGAERFFRRHATLQDKPLKKGNRIQGTVTLRVMP